MGFIMKKICGVLAITFAFTSITNNSLAVSNSSKMGARDILPFTIGALLIICVLFIGYKMDKYSENSSIIKKGKNSKNKKVKHSEEITEKKETEIYDKVNNEDIPYESNENEYYENDNNFDYDSELNDETEYEEDDVSLFSCVENNKESSFDDIDDSISYSDSTMVFDTNELKETQNVQETQKEEQDAESFMNELNRYKEEAEKEDDDFVGFTTKVTPKKIEKVEQPPKKEIVEEDVKEDLVEEKNVKTDTNKKEIDSEQMDVNFLNQIEQNLKRNQEERMRKAGILEEQSIENNVEEKPKKRGRKPKKQED